MTLNWQCKFFDELTVHELYKILRLRSEVFVVEQNCAFLDADDKDQKCYHLSGYDNDNLVAYVRLVPPGISYKEPAIGRVVTSPAYRGSGAGKALMIRAIEVCTLIFAENIIRIGAQLYLQKFYTSLGFIQSSDEYDEDGIPHNEMIKPAESI